MILKTCITLALLTATLVLPSQNELLKINLGIVLPKDSADSKSLRSSLNSFLVMARGDNEENKLVLESEKIETYILLDEFRDIEKNSKLKDEHFYSPYLINCMPIENEQYLLQVAYIGLQENVPILRASFEIVAHKTKEGYVFSSPLIRNTKNWKVQTMGNVQFHFQNSLNKQKANEYQRYETLFDKKLKSLNKTTVFYCCANISELQKLVGVNYKLDYNGRKESVWSSVVGNKKLIVLGNNNASFTDFDPHDTWHERLSLVVPRNKVNKPVDEGCAYLYGGSWGLSWKEIFKEFKLQIASNAATNWMEIKEKPEYFKTVGYNNSVDCVVNALLVQKIEKERGFEAVWEFLNIGPVEKGNEKYYSMLEKLSGITKETYNTKVWELIHAEK